MSGATMPMAPLSSRREASRTSGEETRTNGVTPIPSAAWLIAAALLGVASVLFLVFVYGAAVLALINIL